MLIIFRLATRSFVSVFPVENEKIDVLQSMSCCISIDAEFDADSENVYFFVLILTSFRFISEKLPILVPVQENMQKSSFSLISESSHSIFENLRLSRSKFRLLIKNVYFCLSVGQSVSHTSFSHVFLQIFYKFAKCTLVTLCFSDRHTWLCDLGCFEIRIFQ